MKSLFRQNRLAIYALKRRYGQSITLCRTTNNSTNFTTGLQTETLVKLAINRAVILPSKGDRDSARFTSFENKNFTYGGYFDVKTRIILISKRDVTSFTVDQNMHILFSGKRWEVKELREYEEDEIISVLAQELEGAQLKDVLSSEIADTIVIADSATETIL